MTKTEATKLAKALAKKLGPGWKPFVWEGTSGWRYEAELLGGHIMLNESPPVIPRKTYQCLISSREFIRIGDPRWTDTLRYDTPSKAIVHVLMLMMAHAETEMAWVMKVITTIGRTTPGFP